MNKHFRANMQSHQPVRCAVAKWVMRSCLKMSGCSLDPVGCVAFTDIPCTIVGTCKAMQLFWIKVTYVHEQKRWPPECTSAKSWHVPSKTHKTYFVFVAVRSVHSCERIKRSVKLSQRSFWSDENTYQVSFLFQLNCDASWKTPQNNFTKRLMYLFPRVFKNINCFLLIEKSFRS